jgi:hypothetical protein
MTFPPLVFFTNDFFCNIVLCCCSYASHGFKIMLLLSTCC